MRDRTPSRNDQTTDSRPRDGKRAKRGPKSKAATVARRQARGRKYAQQGRA